ncbi:hypothetical protein EGW08_001349, partial [Elysia chlorotica]
MYVYNALLSCTVEPRTSLCVLILIPKKGLCMFSAIRAVGTLEKFAATEEHHVAKHGFDCDHFTPERRPHCVQFNYSLCETTPVHALRGTDLYRKDGQSGPFLFKLWPIALKDVLTPLDVTGEETLPGKSFPALALQRRSKPRKVRPRPKTIHSIEQAVLDEAQALAGSQGGGAQDAKLGGALSKSQPSVLVSVDTSGAGFERMASFRQSQRGLQDIGGSVDRKRRRRTVSGVPSNIMQEIEQFEQERRIDRSSHRKYSLDDLDPVDLDARDRIMQQYLLDIDAAREEREEIAYAEQREGRLLKFLPCRRSRSLPRCVQPMAAALDEGNTSSTRRSKRFSKSPLASLSRLSLYTKRNQSNRSSRTGSLKRHSLLGEKLRSLVNNTLLRPRPKSLDLDALEPDDSASPTRIAANLASTADKPGDITVSRESQVGPGSYYYFDSNHTLPRAQARKYDFPWDSLPKDWTTSVKLREISKRRKEDRQSSSGNWSQSNFSSNRQSLESEAAKFGPGVAGAHSGSSSRLSQYSQGKDSGRGSPSSSTNADGSSTVAEGSSCSGDDWLRALAERAASRGDVTSTSAEALAQLSRVTRQNIQSLDLLVPGRKQNPQSRVAPLEMDNESLYSVDLEGFYTSFHTDSGLKRSTAEGLDDEDFEDKQSALMGLEFDDDLVLEPRSVREFKRSEDTGTIKAKKKKKIPPPPPPRSSSINNDCANSSTIGGHDKTSMRKQNSDSSIENNSCEASPTTLQPALSSPDEGSDHESIYARLKLKTSISVHTFPSWCTGLVSDDEDQVSLKNHLLSASHERLHAESSEVQQMFKKGHVGSLLPGSAKMNMSPFTTAALVLEEKDFPAHSWPRGKRPGSQAPFLQPGILKTPEKDKVAKGNNFNAKTLNFDPVVNLFDAQTPHGVQMPLSCISSSDESGCSP